MSQILNGYVVSVRKKRDREQQLLGNFDEAGGRLRAEFERFFHDPQMREWVDEESNSVAQVDVIHPEAAPSSDILAATMKSGETGVSSEFIRTSSGALAPTAEFQRARDHAEMIPVLVLAKLPDLARFGYLITHSPNRRGIKTQFWDRFKAWFDDRFPHHALDLERAMPSGFYRKVAEAGELKRVTLNKYVKPSDFMEAERGWLYEDSLGKITTTLKSAGRWSLRKRDILDVLKEEAELGPLLTFRGETYDEMRVTFRDQRREHSILLGDNRVPRAGYDVTEQVEYDSLGHPTYESLREVALEYVRLLSRSAGED